LVLLGTIGMLPVYAQKPPEKRILTHADYDIWNTASGFTLAPNGQYLAYTLSPMKGGDTELIVRNTRTQAEYKIVLGSRSTPETPGVPGDDEQPESDQLAGILGAAGVSGIITGGINFTPDSRFLYFPLPPTKAELDKAKAEKKKPEEMPKSVLAVMELNSGKIVERIEGISTYRIVGEGAGILLMKKLPKPEPKTPIETAPMPKPAEKKDDQSGKLPTGKGTTPATTTPRITYGTELLVRDLSNKKETTFADVLDYTLTRDAKTIAYCTYSKASASNGVSVSALLDASSSASIKSGAGKYTRLTWDDAETKLAFFHDDAPTPPSDAKTPAPSQTNKARVWLWTKPAVAKQAAMFTLPLAAAIAPFGLIAAEMNKLPPAVEILGPDTKGLKKDWQILDRGGLNFSADGLKLSVSAAPIPEKKTEPAKKVDGPVPPVTDKFDLDIWHWKDEAIQPMQKVRAASDRNRTYRAVYWLDTKLFRHVQDENLSVSVPDYGEWGIGSDDRKYRGQTWSYPIARDVALVNVRSGEAKPILKATTSGIITSPKYAHLAQFDGKNWNVISIPSGKLINLTAKLGVKFFNEEYDSPSTPPSHGFTGWSQDEKFLFVNDQFDIWQLAVDGSSAKNLTMGRAKQLQYRLARVEKPYDPLALPVIGLDLSKPWLLNVENTQTHDTGFYRMMPNAKPQLLIMGARKYGTPIKATKADLFLFTVQSFTNYPDYYVSSSQFHDVQRVTNINPRISEFNWGKAEPIDFKSTDGLPLQGVLVKPENFDPQKKYPMIVYIYERLSDNLHSFRLPSVSRGQVINPTYYASNGYLVLMPDIAYTTGSPGASAMKCVLPAIQAVADRGCVNEKAIGINGQSWGGYQIAYMVTQTNRFKAAMAGAPVANMVSAYNGIRWGSGMPRQFQYERTQSRIGETLWQAPFKYIENSPVFQADRVQTPLLMIHNDQDDAVPWYQGIEYYLALRRLGKEVYLFNYNGQPHNLASKTAARDFAMRTQQFYDHHLKGKPMPEWMAKGVPYIEREKEKEQWKKLFEGK